MSSLTEDELEYAQLAAEDRVLEEMQRKDREASWESKIIALIQAAELVVHDADNNAETWKLSIMVLRNAVNNINEHTLRRGE